MHSAKRMASVYGDLCKVPSDLGFKSRGGRGAARKSSEVTA